MVQRYQNKKDLSRRKFLKGGVALSAAVGLSNIVGGKTTEKVAQAFGKKELDTFPHEISPDFETYAQNRMMFARGRDPEIAKLLEGLPGMYNVPPDDSKIGRTTLDKALSNGAKTIDVSFSEKVYTWDKKPTGKQFQFTSKETASKAIKKAAHFYGADLVGITNYDEKWMYHPMLLANMKMIYPSDLPFKPKSVIVIAVEMDYEAFSTEPSSIEGAATGLGYSKMVEVTAKLSEFIRQLGFNAAASGNDSAISVPYAIAAGLGEQGRNGLLLTYEYGPRVRICKVFTEMDLIYDKPIKFGANDFCQVCKKCAENCPSKSISLKDEMTWNGETDTISNHTGVFKYYVNVETCYVYWNTIGGGCGVCITTCPFNKPDFWHHRITTALTATPLKPFLNEMDDLFGYGNICDEKAAINFWGIGDYSK